jgi:hypothetical protein
MFATSGSRVRRNWHQLLALSRGDASRQLKDLFGHGRFEVPRERHWLFALMGNVVRRTEKHERHRAKLEVPSLADEQQNLRASLPMIDVALHGWMLGGLTRLRLPVEDLATDRVVAVHSGRRVVALRLLEINKERVGLSFLHPKYSALGDLWLNSFSRTECSDDFLPGVLGVNCQRDLCGERRRYALRGRPLVEQRKKLQNLYANGSLLPERINVFLE